MPVPAGAPALPVGLETPCLVVDLDVVERNAERMARELRGRHVALRPHVKTHKSVRLARVQVAGGAAGITVGTLGEAEVMVAGGIDDIFVAYPLWAAGTKAARLRALHDRERLRLAVGLDSVAAARLLSAALHGNGREARVLVEVDPGNRRTGVRPEEAGELGRAAAALGLEVVGAFTHGGHAYAGRDAVPGAASDEVAALTVAADSLRRAGIEPQVLSAGSSPTALAAASSPVSEVRPGTYLVGDRQQVALGATPPAAVALAVAATVVSTAVDGQVVVDAGAKSLTKDVPVYLRGHGYLPQYPDAVLERLSDYHGVVTFPAASRRPALGEVVAIIPNHACPVIDLYDTFIATRSGDVVGRWPVDARGRSG
ncbi:MAG: alanine racemase [Chloroflexota bacterium]|nr:alanine racemase [Chloroflexota bacterium]